MGYRSDVSMVFYSRDLEHLPRSSLKLWFDENYPHKEAVEDYGAAIQTGEDFVLVTYEAVKWYEGYRHINAVRESLDTFESTFDADASGGLGSYELVEVDEETQDIRETRSFYNDYRLGVVRKITFS